MKLTTILKNITPLPWRIDEHGSVLSGKNGLRDKIALTGFSLAMGSNTGEAEANNRYVHHSANVLPELVAAASEFKYSVLRNGGVSEELIYRLQNAITSAEEIKS